LYVKSTPLRLKVSTLVWQGVPFKRAYRVMGSFLCSVLITSWCNLGFNAKRSWIGKTVSNHYLLPNSNGHRTPKSIRIVAPI